MIYTDYISQACEELLYKDSAVKFLIQPLDHWENALGEYSAEIVRSESSLTVNKGNGCRRSLSLKLYGKDGIFAPNKNSDIWYNRKIKILAEICGGNDTYRFSQGVFLCSEAQITRGIVRVSGVDKYANLNGEYNVGTLSTPFSTDISRGMVYVGEVIREALLRDIGCGYPIDPVPPLIDPYFDTEPLYSDIALSAGQHYGDIITRLAEMYGADCYYNPAGHLVFQRRPTYSRPEWYMHLGYIYRYKDRDKTVQAGSEVGTHRFDGVNCVTVASDSVSGETVSYTARNLNALSPVNVGAVGERWADPPVRYISIGDTSSGDSLAKCREYAEYLLLQRTRDSVSEAFTSIYLPHFDVDKVIRYKDEDFVIDSLSIDLGSRAMGVKASNTAFMPSNRSVIGYE